MPENTRPLVGLPGMTQALRAAAEDEAAQERLTKVLNTTVKLDTTALNAAMARIRESFREWGRQFAEAVRTALQPLIRWMHKLHDDANSVVNVAGLEAKFYMRSALAPYDPGADPRLVQRILAGDMLLDFHLVLLTPENRRVVALAAMRGEAERTEATRGTAASYSWGAELVAF